MQNINYQRIEYNPMEETKKIAEMSTSRKK